MQQRVFINRIMVEVYQKFTISNCGTDFLRLNDGVTTATKCGVIRNYQHIYTTSSNLLQLWYKSDLRIDKIALSLKGVLHFLYYLMAFQYV